MEVLCRSRTMAINYPAVIKKKKKNYGYKWGLLTWLSKNDQKRPCNMTENAEDCKRYFFYFKIDWKWQL